MIQMAPMSMGRMAMARQVSDVVGVFLFYFLYVNTVRVLDGVGF